MDIFVTIILYFKKFNAHLKKEFSLMDALMIAKSKMTSIATTRHISSLSMETKPKMKPLIFVRIKSN